MEVGRTQQLICSFDGNPATTSKAIDDGANATIDVVNLTEFVHPILFVQQTGGTDHDLTATNVDFYPCLPDGTLTSTASIGTATITPIVGTTNHYIALPLGLSNLGMFSFPISIPALKIKFTNGDADKPLAINSAIVLASQLV